MPERAIEQFDRALTIHPSFFPSHVGRAWALGMLGRYDEAIAERQVFGFLRGFMLARVGRYREAEQAIADDIQLAATNQNADEQGLLRLASAVLALDRKQAATAAEHVNRAEQILSQVPAPRRKTLMVLANTLGGLSALQAGSRDRARAKLNAAQTLCEPEVDPERWWCSLLDAEIALSGGQTEKAAAAFSAGEPAGKMWLQLSSALMSLLANNLHARDWKARLASARGDTAGAIRLYRGLLTTGPEQKWAALYEPRYVLEVARLLERSGDRSGAAREYSRFLEFWKNADSDLPELTEARRAIR
jgi:tetratricopeptide (TPR) repeat protein